MSSPVPDPVITFKGLMKPVHSLMFSLKDDEEVIYAGTQEGNIHVWDLKTNREIIRYTVGSDSAIAIHKARLDNAEALVTQEKSGAYKIWTEDILKRELNLVRTFKLEYYGFCRCIIYANKFVVCPCNNGCLKVISLKGDGDFMEIKSDTSEKIGEIMVMKLVNDCLLLVYESGIIKTWSMVGSDWCDSKKLIDSCPMAFDVSNTAITGDRHVGYIGSDSETVWELELYGHGLWISKGRELHITNPGVSCIKIRKDNRLVALSCWDKRLRLVSCMSFKLLVVLDFHKDLIQDITFSDSKVTCWNNKYLLAAGSLDGRISLWNLYNF